MFDGELRHILRNLEGCAVDALRDSLSIFRASGEVGLAGEEVDAALVRVDIFDVFTCVLLVRVEVDTAGVHAVAGLTVDSPRLVLGVLGLTDT